MSILGDHYDALGIREEFAIIDQNLAEPEGRDSEDDTIRPEADLLQIHEDI
ncbi:hypothetical protein [Microvirga tunisiensis]|uniref:hypothetical protein n=1 Tax=Microvirga tunisiensis TaxID=2108360 RepID=UPI00129C81FD|nr:hypothetical protein [Microvirga tunisiensis]